MSNKTKQNLEPVSKEDTQMTDATPEKKQEVPVVEVSREEKKRLRRAQIENMGPLHLDSKYKKPGFRQRLVNVTDGNVEKMKLAGYSPIQRIDGADCGNGTVDTAHTASGMLEVQTGRSSPMTSIWMEIAEEDAQILDEIRDDKAREQYSMIEKIDIPQDVRIGKVTREV